MILTKDFFKGYGCCEDGYRYAIQVGAIGNWTLEQAIEHCREAGLHEFADDLKKQKATELYVRMNGSVLKMGAFQVFNPTTGMHNRFDTEEEAKAEAVKITNELIANLRPHIVQELSNENGDTCWIPTRIEDGIVAVFGDAAP